VKRGLDGRRPCTCADKIWYYITPIHCIHQVDAFLTPDMHSVPVTRRAPSRLESPERVAPADVITSPLFPVMMPSTVKKPWKLRRHRSVGWRF